MLDDRNLVQVVEEPTRDKDTLDLFATNYPAQVNRLEVKPGISDHDIPLVEIDVKPIKRRHTQRQIPLYRKAQWDKIKEELEEVNKKISNEPNVKSADELWFMFRDSILDAIHKYVPIKTSKKKENLQYMTAEISKLIKKRDIVFKKRAKARKKV